MRHKPTHYTLYQMTNKRIRVPAGMKRISVTVPEDVADYYADQGQRYGTSVSSAASPVLCAQARGEITTGFVKHPGADVRPER